MRKNKGWSDLFPAWVQLVLWLFDHFPSPLRSCDCRWNPRLPFGQQLKEPAGAITLVSDKEQTQQYWLKM